MQVLAQCSAWVPNVVRVKLSAERTIGQELEGAETAAPSWGWSEYAGGPLKSQAGELHFIVNLGTPLYI